MEDMTPWKLYAEDTIVVIKLTSIKNVFSILNSFVQNI